LSRIEINTGREERSLIKKLVKTVISLSRLRTPEERRAVISADPLIHERENKLNMKIHDSKVLFHFA
jgi:hypothetical protein